MLARPLLPLLDERIQLSLCIGDEGALIGALQPRHLRRAVDDLLDSDHAGRPRSQDDRDRRIVDDDIAGVRLFGMDDKNAVLEVLVVDRPVVEQPDVGTRRLQLIDERERKRAEHQAAKAGGGRTVLNSCDWRVDDQSTGGRDLSGKKSECPPYESQESGTGGLLRVESKRVHDNAAAGVELKNRSVRENDDDTSVGAGLDKIAFMDGIAGNRAGRHAVAPDGDLSARSPHPADGRRTHQRSATTPRAVTVARSSGATKHRLRSRIGRDACLPFTTAGLQRCETTCDQTAWFYRPLNSAGRTLFTVDDTLPSFRAVGERLNRVKIPSGTVAEEPRRAPASGRALRKGPAAALTFRVSCWLRC